MVCRQAGGRWSSALIAWAIVSCAAVACGPSGKYIGVDRYRQAVPASTADYRIAPGDVINVREFNPDALSARTPGRAAGKGTLPVLNDVPAAGQSPGGFAKTLQQLLL